MLAPAPSVWAFTALLVSMLVIVVYLAIFFMAFYIIGWGLAHIVRPVIAFISHD